MADGRATPELAREGDRPAHQDRLVARVDAGHIVLILGKKRSGKSTLATAIASRFDRVFAVIPREEDALPNSRLCGSGDEVKRAVREGAHRMSYLPRRDELPRIREIVDEILEQLIATRMAWVLLFHEGGDVGDEHETLPALSQIIRQFSAKGWVVIWLYQRAYELPRIVTANVDHVFLFAMPDPGELARAAEMMGRPVRDDPLPLPFDYSYYQRTPDGRLLRVDQRRRTARLVSTAPPGRV